MFSYETHVLPFKENFKKIIVPEEKVKRINDFVNELIKVKEKESHHSIDNRSHFKRYYTGTLGEVALEEYLGTEGIVDWTIGDSKEFHKPDLSKIGVMAGIKTVEFGSFPLIFKYSYTPEIIMIKVSGNHVVLCGLATVDVLNTYQSDELVNDNRILRKGTKTGFYGFKYLLKFATLDELRKITPTKKDSIF